MLIKTLVGAVTGIEAVTVTIEVNVTQVIEMNNTSSWNMNGNGTISCFTALPGWQHSSKGSYYCIGGCGYWWNSAENDPDFSNGVWYRSVSDGFGNTIRTTESEKYGLSVRCNNIYDQADNYRPLQ